MSFLGEPAENTPEGYTRTIQTSAVTEIQSVNLGSVVFKTVNSVYQLTLLQKPEDSNE